MTISRRQQHENKRARERRRAGSLLQANIQPDPPGCASRGSRELSGDRETDLERKLLNGKLVDLVAKLSEDSRLARVWTLIEEQYPNAELRLGAAARECGVSRDHLNEILRRDIGLTFHQFLVRYRILKAIHMMRAADGTALDIALDVGFGSMSAFHRNFSRVLGAAPRVFLQLWPNR